MKIILLSDIHLVVDRPVCRLDKDIVDTEFKKLDFVFNYAFENNIKAILQGGDLFDIKRSWELMPKITSFLSEYKSKGINLFCVRGQHDSYYHSMTNNKTMMGTLISGRLVTLLNNTSPDNIKGCNVYGASYGEPVPSPRLATLNNLCDINILVIHKQILMHKLWKKQEDYDYAPDFLTENSDFDLIICGDAHQKFIFSNNKRFIVNTGCMLRLEASDNCINHKPCFATYDTDKKKIEWIEIPHAPASKIISDAHLLRKKEIDHNFEEFIEKIKASNGANSLSFGRNLKLFFKRNNTPDHIKAICSEYLGKVDY